jgi:hypothetical protein
MRISVVICSHNRASYFRRSLECYALQPHKDLEIILLDDDSSDELEHTCKCWASALGLDLKYFWFQRKGVFYPRSHTQLINYGLRAAEGELIITTAPEVMVGRTTLTEMADHASTQFLNFYNARPYLLTREEQLKLDTVNWRKLGPSAAVRLIPGFYESPTADHCNCPEYQHAAVDQAETFHTDLFGGMTRATWRLIGGHPQTEVWGAEDMSFLRERVRLGIADVTMPGPDSTVVHQNHDGPEDFHFVRDLNVAMANLVLGPWDNIRW